MDRKVSVLIVDDSATAREVLTRGLSAAPGIQVVGAAADAYQARDMIVELRPDVLSLDIEMPRMSGLEFLRRLMPQHPLPVVMVSALTSPGAQATLDALEAGAVDFVLKPSAGAGAQAMVDALARKLVAAAGVDPRQLVARPQQPAAHRDGREAKGSGAEGRPAARGALLQSSFSAIAIGASTGGTVALANMINAFPKEMPGTVVVQHMPPVFTRMFAERLDRTSEVEVKEAEDGDAVLPGRVLVAPGDVHMKIWRSGSTLRVRCVDGEKVNGHRPSVEVLFDSIPTSIAPRSIAVVLTGMGRDGALAMKRMRDAGARTLAQDRETSVVFGMPKEAYACGGAERLVPIQEMTDAVISILEGRA